MKQALLLGIQKAIERENDSYSHYLSMERLARTPNQRQLFSGLAVEELRHRALLREALLGASIKKALAKKSWEHEPDLRAGLFVTAETAGLADALQRAIQREGESIAHYRRLHEAAGDPELAELFLILQREEEGHARQLSHELERM